MTQYQKTMLSLTTVVAAAFAFVWSVTSAAQITLDGEEQAWKVTGVQLERVEGYSCHPDERVFAQRDTNQDGVLDAVCVGLKYDPCDIHTLQVNMIRDTMLGRCRTLEDVRRDEACADDWYPKPEDC